MYRCSMSAWFEKVSGGKGKEGIEDGIVAENLWTEHLDPDLLAYLRHLPGWLGTRKVPSREGGA